VKPPTRFDDPNLDGLPEELLAHLRHLERLVGEPVATRCALCDFAAVEPVADTTAVFREHEWGRPDSSSIVLDDYRATCSV